MIQTSAAATVSHAGGAVERQETCAPSSVRRVAAMLDLDPDEADALPALPRGWHFLLMAADTRRSALRADGFPGLGMPVPDLGLPRLMLGGRSVAFHHDIPIGANLMRHSVVRSSVPKVTSAGPMAVVTIAHELTLEGAAQPALSETQTYLMLPPRSKGVAAPEALASAPVSAHRRKQVVPDETLLFQYSALGFNSHRIHIDREYARQVEGFADLVVNGGLCTLLLTEFLRRDLGVTPAAVQVRHLAPLYCNRPITMTADPDGEGWTLKAYDDHDRLAVDMKVEIQ